MLQKIDDLYMETAVRQLSEPFPDGSAERIRIPFNLDEIPAHQVQTVRAVMEFYYGAQFTGDGHITVDSTAAYAVDNKLIFEGRNLWTEMVVKNDEWRDRLVRDGFNKKLLVTESELRARLKELPPQLQELFCEKTLMIPVPTRESESFLTPYWDASNKKLNGMNQAQFIEYIRRFELVESTIPVLNATPQNQFVLRDARLMGKYTTSIAGDTHLIYQNPNNADEIHVLTAGRLIHGKLTNLHLPERGYQEVPAKPKLANSGGMINSGDDATKKIKQELASEVFAKTGVLLSSSDSIQALSQSTGIPDVILWNSLLRAGSQKSPWLSLQDANRIHIVGTWDDDESQLVLNDTVTSVFKAVVEQIEIKPELEAVFSRGFKAMILAESVRYSESPEGKAKAQFLKELEQSPWMECGLIPNLGDERRSWSCVQMSKIYLKFISVAELEKVIVDRTLKLTP